MKSFKEELQDFVAGIEVICENFIDLPATLETSDSSNHVLRYYLCDIDAVERLRDSWCILVNAGFTRHYIRNSTLEEFITARGLPKTYLSDFISKHGIQFEDFSSIRVINGELGTE